MKLNSLELFVGAGGLAIGISQAGFNHLAVIDKDKYSIDTLEENKRQNVHPISEWNIFNKAVQEFDFSSYEGRIDLLSGGPPCQPFSIGGKHKGSTDNRNMFPATVDVIRKVRPKVVLIENVKGLLRQSFCNYFEYIILSLEYCDVEKKRDENWVDHLRRLERYKSQGAPKQYNAVFNLLNAANYGVPQKRERVLIVAFRDNLGIPWSFEEVSKTHSLDSLLWDQWVSGYYWEKHKISKKNRPQPSAKHIGRIKRLKEQKQKPQSKSWLTVRDAIADLPDPKKHDLQNEVLNHAFVPGARVYAGHTGSPIDETSKTLKAGDHGVPGGENMIAFPTGEVRYFTVRESARIQTFPDGYAFHGAWTESMRQLGNAVPVSLSYAVAKGIRKFL